MTPSNPASTYLVVFLDPQPLPRCSLLRLLTPGFRHCLVIGRMEPHAGSATVAVELVRGHVEVTPMGCTLQEARAYYEGLGHTTASVIYSPPASLSTPRRRLPPGLPTCTQLVKQVVGLAAPGVLTPWQLRRYLLRHPVILG